MSSVANLRVSGTGGVQTVQITAQDCRESLADDPAGGRAGERLEALTAGVPAILVKDYGIGDDGESVCAVGDDAVGVSVLAHVLPRWLMFRRACLPTPISYVINLRRATYFCANFAQITVACMLPRG